MAFDVNHWLSAVLAAARGDITEEHLSAISGLTDSNYLQDDIALLMREIDADLAEYDRKQAEQNAANTSTGRRHVSLANAFQAWHADAGAVVQAEVRAIKRRGRIHMRFPRYHELRGTIARSQMRVWASRDGRAFELYTGMPCRPQPVEGGVICSFCTVPTVFADAEALWEDHIFDELRNIATALSKSSRLSFVESHGAAHVMLI